MVMFIRLGLSTIVGVVVTLGLFYLMQYLIQGADSALTDDKIGNLVDFVRVKQDQQLETKQRKPKKPPPPDEPPPDVPPQNFNVAVDSAGFNMSNVDLSVSVDVGGGGFGIDGWPAPTDHARRLALSLVVPPGTPPAANGLLHFDGFVPLAAAAALDPASMQGVGGIVFVSPINKLRNASRKNPVFKS